MIHFKGNPKRNTVQFANNKNCIPYHVEHVVVGEGESLQVVTVKRKKRRQINANVLFGI